jgi:hypothetical protein
MARMIPSLVSETEISPGEKELFRILRDDSAASDWVCLHSYDLPKDRNGVRREIDFLVIVPRLGLCVIEVKAHTFVSRDNYGNWHLGRGGITKKSPVTQLKDATYSMKRRLESLGFENLKVAPLLIFTDTEVPHIPELDEENQLSRRQGPISLSIANQVISSITAEPGLKMTGKLGEKLASAIRPSFEVIASPRLRQERNTLDLKNSTEMQLRAFDLIAANPRVLVEGPPGSGKTATAVEAARRAAESAQGVQLLCFNSLLGRSLKQEAAGEFKAGSVFSFLTDFLGRIPPPSSDFGWWSVAIEEYCERVQESQKCDFLVVDEFQDLQSAPWVALLDHTVRGGLQSGKWLFAGDSNFQDIQGGRNSNSPFSAASPTRVSFQDNCRNPEIQGRWIEDFAFGKEVYRSFLRSGYGSQPRVEFIEGPLEDAVRSAINSLRQRFDGSEIVVICADSARQRDLMKKLKLPEYYPGILRVSISTTRSFKGLESPAVIVDLDLGWSDSEIMTAGTRATSEIVLLVPKDQENLAMARVVR